MKTRRLNLNNAGNNSETTQSKIEAAEFHSKRLSRELKIRTQEKSASRPVGNDEYEQLIAEDADFNTRYMIAEAAYFFAERRGFAPGHELSDWLQAEINVENLLRSPVFDRRNSLNADRRKETVPA